METAITKYGAFEDIGLSDYFENGALRRCIVRQEYRVTLPCGTFIPQYLDDGNRKKLLKSMTFYAGGALSSLILQQTEQVQTSLGSLPAEMVTFYESGAVKRIFPTFGSISAYWTESDEQALSPTLDFDLPVCAFSGKVINIAFYETGEPKSLTLWPGDSVFVKTPLGTMQTRIGFCLYPDGSVRSVEPPVPAEINTPIGRIPAFDPDAIALDGEANSLVFAPNGAIESLLTCTAKVVAADRHNKQTVHAPAFQSSFYFDDRQAVAPMKVRFSDGIVSFGRRKGPAAAVYDIDGSAFRIEPVSIAHCANICDACE
ncbi:hypothetical protein [Ethanoligenens harbinense]|uniref:Uncharacterized protein n=1 Tax=Ethanoligenens harbinense (strain DSM 18485 / JCM 12961 / CGMCC 1.5033 / YUAN-3) TaxID=663278 RepID=E6U4U9_ETHHY|nr:hypothetical protein [Ethanoligenens harbinense]ADU27834.1 hypothetical protein Ethha_2322 [Ethanoligenens harbinense YUAN-3]AVQ96857.1 hypothetical protein CXQ68_11945 [Ethanoligenens harbinense YUAN-3]AYF39519.1 hypothetical protein CXP51_11840 [Ethanoligenens harbinense]AYF42344.1 hypothetical protein CN246_12390 [Ethanoligenens harbinense]QCN93098.1 hypothetical protein DRA42_11980 [Ethanoligenens harbinense]